MFCDSNVQEAEGPRPMNQIRETWNRGEIYAMNGDQIEKARERAREIFNGKRANCAESVFRAIHEQVDSPLPPEVAS